MQSVARTLLFWCMNEKALSKGGAQFNPQIAVRANWSQGFALASDFAKCSSDLSVNVFRQTELGVQWKLFSQWLIDAALLGPRPHQCNQYRMGQQLSLPGPGLAIPLASLARNASLNLWLRNAANTRYASTTVLIGGQRLIASGAPRSVQLGLQFSL